MPSHPSHPEARADLLAVSALNVSDANIHELLGHSFLAREDFDSAVREFRMSLLIDPGRASTQNALGYTLADRNIDLMEAEKLIRAAVDADRGNGSYLDSLAWLYFRTNRLTLAERYSRIAVLLDGQSPEVREHLGDIYDAQGKRSEAVAVWKEALRISENAQKFPSSQVAPGFNLADVSPSPNIIRLRSKIVRRP
jgi:Flp pilus assembly protein TadD